MSSPASTAAAAAQRIERIGSHVGHVTVNPTSATAAGTATATAPSAVPVDLVALTDLVLGSKSRAARHNVFQVIASEPALFKYDYNTTKETQREVAWARLKKLNEHGFIRPYAADDFETAHLQNEALNIVDHSVNTLIGAQFVLFAGSIRKLGSETHQEKYLKDAEAMKLRGCFAMTELGHGSNVRGLETTATYDRKTDELVIHTPTETAQKYWIGGGMDAQMATVFAQLIVKGVNYGVHAVLVPLRYSFFELFFFFHRLLTSFSVATPRQTSSCPASVSRTVVLSRACMLLRKEERKHNSQYNKLSNGVSNARFWFNNVRVPRENLLSKYGDINAEGDYESLIADNDMRFAATIANLLVGRIGIVSGSTAVSKIGLATYPFKPWSLSLSLSYICYYCRAIKYAHTRRQFGPSNAPETPIIEYTTTQLRLLPFLATTYAHSFISRVVAKELHEAQTNGDFQAVKKLHVILSGLKAICSWHCAESLSLAREACGGQGFKTSNRIGFLMGETDVFKTYEGDNMVLLQGVRCYFFQ